MNKRLIKILIAAGNFPPDIGGPARMLEQLAHDLLENDFQLNIITYTSEKTQTQTRQVRGKKYKVAKINRQIRIFAHLLYFVKMLILAWQSDLIYVPDTYSIGNFARLIKKFLGKKYIIRFTGESAWETAQMKGWTNDYIEEFQQKKYDSRIEALKKRSVSILQDADAVITDCDFMRHIASLMGVDTKKFITIRNSIEFVGHKPDQTKIGQLKIRSSVNQKILVTACRLTPWKGVDGIIRAIPAIKARCGDLKLIVLGEGQEKDRLSELSRTLGLNDSVNLIGKVPFSEVINYLAASDIFILNSNYEGMSHILLEAMQCGIPVISTYSGGTPEIITSGQEGLLVHYNNEQEIVDAVVQLLSDQQTAKEMAARAMTRAQKFSWAQTVSQTASLIKQIQHV
jgi:glycosyltransferase involved in cell wall biosynthesis